MRGIVVVAAIAGCAGGVDNDGHSNSGIGGSSSGSTGTASDSLTNATVTPADTSSSSADPTAPTTVVDTSDASTVDPSEGTTAADCSSAWRVEHAGELTHVTGDAATGTVFAVGVSPGGSGWALALDACDGTVLADTAVDHPGADTTRLDGAVVEDGSLFVAGSVTSADSPRDGLYARLDPVDLQAVWSAPLYGGDGQDEVLDIVVSPAGDLWMAGTANFDINATAWVIAGSPDGNACGFPWGALGSGSARAIARDGDEVVVAVAAADGLVIARYDPMCDCSCPDAWSSAPIAIGTGTTAVGDLLVKDGQYYVAGWSSDDSPDVIDGYVAWVSPAGALAGMHTGALETSGGFFFVGADANRMYVGGVEGYAPMAGFDDASAVLRALDLPLGADPDPLWSVRPAEVDSINAIAIEPGADGMLYVGGNIDGEGVIVRCDKQGDCG